MGSRRPVPAPLRGGFGPGIAAVFSRSLRHPLSEGACGTGRKQKQAVTLLALKRIR